MSEHSGKGQSGKYRKCDSSLLPPSPPALLYEPGHVWIIVRRRIGDLIAIVARTMVEDGPIELEIQAETDTNRDGISQYPSKPP